MVDKTPSLCPCRVPHESEHFNFGSVCGTQHCVCLRVKKSPNLQLHLIHLFFCQIMLKFRLIYGDTENVSPKSDSEPVKTNCLLGKLHYLK